MSLAWTSHTDAPPVRSCAATAKGARRAGQRAQGRAGRAAAAALSLTLSAMFGLTAAAIPSASAATVRAPAVNRCNLGVVEAVAGESSAADERQTAAWTLLRANGWTVFAPEGGWHLSASDAGADVGSPDGRSDASLATWYSLDTPWTMAALGNKILSEVSGIRVVCRSPLEHGPGGSTQATELTGVYSGERIHAVVILSLLTPSGNGLYVGETRSLFTPSAQWSTAYERTLMLIIKRAIETPQAP